MTNEEELSKALQDFKTKYPSITSADLQTFIIGWQEAVKNCFIPDVSGMFSADKLEQAYKDGVRDAIAKGYGTFNEENYR